MVEQSSDGVKSNFVFKTVSDFLIKQCGGVGVSMHNVGVASLQDRWVKVAKDEDLFLVTSAVLECNRHLEEVS